MAKIYKVTDRIPLKVDDLTIIISPLTFEQKMQVQSEILNPNGQGAMRGARLACQYAVKDIIGLEDADGNKFELKMDSDKLSDASWDDLQNIEQTQKLITVCLNLINGIPKEFVNPQTGKKLDGVSFVKDDASKKK